MGIRGTAEADGMAPSRRARALLEEESPRQ